MSYRKQLHQNYSGLFSVDKPSEEEEEIRGETEVEKRKRLREEREEQEKADKWNLYSLLYNLAKGDITKIPQILELNFLFVLTHKSYEVENKKVAEYYDNGRFTK